MRVDRATTPREPGDASGPAERRPAEPKRARGEQTRALIVETALRLFRDRGYEATTMRAIAEEAGVSLGNAYYYFASKEQLVQAFYDRTQDELAAAAAPLLARERRLPDRLAGVLHTWVDLMAPYHAFAGKFFKNAAEPTSPLSPFSPESRPARQAAIALYRDVALGSNARLTRQLRDALPELLWLVQMGVVLYWVHDRSAGSARTHLLIDRVTPLVARLIGMGRAPLLRSTVDDVLALVRDLGAPEEGATR